MPKINPIEIEGTWSLGYALDNHVIRGHLLGRDKYGDEYFAKGRRSELGELLFKLRSKPNPDELILKRIVNIIVNSSKVGSWEVIVPVPSSKGKKLFDATEEISKELGIALGLPVELNVVRKADFDGIPRTLNRTNPFEIAKTSEITDKFVLLFDGVYGASTPLDFISEVLYSQGQAREVNVLTLTITDSGIAEEQAKPRFNPLPMSPTLNITGKTRDDITGKTRDELKNKIDHSSLSYLIEPGHSKTERMLDDLCGRIEEVLGGIVTLPCFRPLNYNDTYKVVLNQRFTGVYVEVWVSYQRHMGGEGIHYGFRMCTDQDFNCGY